MLENLYPSETAEAATATLTATATASATAAFFPNAVWLPKAEQSFMWLYVFARCHGERIETNRRNGMNKKNT